MKLLQAASRPLAADSTTLVADLPPACVPSLRIDLAAALSHFVLAARHIEKGDATDMQAADIELTGGWYAYRQVPMDVNQFTNESS